MKEALKIVWTEAKVAIEAARKGGEETRRKADAEAGREAAEAEAKRTQV